MGGASPMNCALPLKYCFRAHAVSQGWVTTDGGRQAVPVDSRLPTRDVGLHAAPRDIPCYPPRRNEAASVLEMAMGQCRRGVPFYTLSGSWSFGWEYSARTGVVDVLQTILIAGICQDEASSYEPRI
jgi:hypothetical protein